MCCMRTCGELERLVVRINSRAEPHAHMLGAQIELGRGGSASAAATSLDSDQITVEGGKHGANHVVG